MQSKNEVTALYEYDKDESRQLIEKLSCERSLYYFVKKAWPYFDPQPFVGGFHLEAICEHLQAVTRGEIKRLLINIPPGLSKSSVVAVCWPAWAWAQSDIDHLSGPQVQFMYSTYAQNLTERDSTKTRNLIDSEWYQNHWGDRFKMVGDQNTKRKFANNKMGYRLATSVGGTTTGDGGKIIAVDDPLSAAEANSEAARNNVITWWTETMPMRLRDPENGAKVVIMQRLHQEDLSGYILEGNDDDEWTHLCLPMHFDPENRCVTSWISDGERVYWEDPRTEPGELLCPARYTEEVLIGIEKELGSYGVAGQMQQVPAPKGGGIIKVTDWQIWPPEGWPEDVPVTFPGFEYLIASVDTAYTTKQENDYSACVVFGIFRDAEGLPKAMLIEAWQERLEFKPLIDKLMTTCRKRKVDSLLIETKASGLSVMQEIQRLCKAGDFNVIPIDPGTLDKVARVYAIQPSFEGKLIYAPDRMYADMVIRQFEAFPKAKHDDLVDASTNCLFYLRRLGMLLQEPEARQEKLEDEMYKPRSIPISQHYGV